MPTLVLSRPCIRCGGAGAMVARATPDRKVIRSSRVFLTFDGFPSFSPPFLFFSNRAPGRPPGPLAIVLPCMLYQVQVDDCLMCRKGRHCDVGAITPCLPCITNSSNPPSSLCHIRVAPSPSSHVSPSGLASPSHPWSLQFPVLLP
jgi:hypothetical protein